MKLNEPIVIEAASCRRCSECPGAEHHWIDNDECENETDPTHACKHCDAVGDECKSCDGNGTPDDIADDTSTGTPCADCRGFGIVAITDECDKASTCDDWCGLLINDPRVPGSGLFGTADPNDHEKPFSVYCTQECLNAARHTPSACTTCGGAHIVATRWPSGYPHATPCPACRPGVACCGPVAINCPGPAAVAAWKASK